ncbi:MAG: serine protease [Bryobacteraceae bacterium]
MAFRRILNDGFGVVRCEIGVHFIARQLSITGCLDVLKEFFDIPCSVRLLDGTTEEGPLLRQGNSLCRLYEAATRAKGAQARTDLVSMGRPGLLVEYSAADLTDVPNIIGAKLPQQGISYGHLSHRGTEVGAWFVKAELQSSLRDTRITLLRLHAEHQALRRVARGLASQKIVPQPQSNEAAEMKDFISRTLGHLTKPKRFGIAQQGFLKLMNVYQQVAAGDDIPLVVGNLARFSSQVGLNLQKYLEDKSAGTTAEGPEFEWQANPEQIEYHLGRLKAQLIDARWLRSALSNLAPAVCLIKVAKLGISATGFLIARDLVITNYHVLSSSEDSLLPPDMLTSVQLSFDFATPPNDLKIFTLAQNPVVWSSSVPQLDCLLLRVSEDVTASAAIQPIVANNAVVPEDGAGLLIIQHPQGESLKLFTSPNSVTEVRSQSGLVRYLSLADHGSSGAPCFDDDQRLVAVHHAERGTPFGSVREGILFSSIYPQIQIYL